MKKDRCCAIAAMADPTPPEPTTSTFTALEDPRFACEDQARVVRNTVLKAPSLTDCVGNGTNRLALRRTIAQPAVAEPRRGPISAPSIDGLDQGIIEALQANGRESFRAIAARLGVSEATIRARYARLCAEDILQVVGVTNPLGLGFDQALVGVKTAGSPEPVADEIAQLDRRPTTSSSRPASSTSSSRSSATDRRELLELTNRMRALDGVVSTETFLYLQMVKQLYDWGTRVREDR